MDRQLILFIVIGIVILAFAFFLLKSLVKAALITVVILLIFRVGWIYSSDDVINMFRLDKIMSPENVAEFRIGYDDYKEKREDDPIIIPEAVDETVRSEIQQKVAEYLEKLKNGEED